jgi:hypothetical protein
MVSCIPDLTDPHFSLLIIFPAFPFLHMCLCSPKSPLMTVGKKLSTSLSPTTVDGPLCPYLYHHQLIPMFKFLLLFRQYSPHTSKRLKNDIPQPVQDKGKAMVSPCSPSTESSNSVSSCLHLKYDCSHVINEIQPQGSNQPRATQEKSVGDNSEKRKYALQSNKYGF